jgi:hypothetical protein
MRARAFLRRDFSNRCAYCCIHEHDIGEDNFETDHFHPVERGGAVNDYANLYWACRGCNMHKSDRWPTEAMVQHGVRFADPCAELDFPTHFLEDEGGVLIPISPCGGYHIDALRLNRTSRLERRRRRNDLLARLAVVTDLIQSLPDDIANSPQGQSILETIKGIQEQTTYSLPFLR